MFRYFFVQRIGIKGLYHKIDGSEHGGDRYIAFGSQRCQKNNGRILMFLEASYYRDKLKPVYFGHFIVKQK